LILPGPEPQKHGAVLVAGLHLAVRDVGLRLLDDPAKSVDFRLQHRNDSHTQHTFKLIPSLLYYLMYLISSDYSLIHQYCIHTAGVPEQKIDEKMKENAMLECFQGRNFYNLEYFIIIWYIL
jgi:hypothetical protein